jgi:class 3 adenylate cyclase
MLSTAASAEAYTPRHLAARILTATAALEGERKQVAVLFADLKGSMEPLADRDPEDARNHGFTFAEGVRAAVSAHLERCSQQLRRELVLITEQGDHCEDTRNPEDHFE